MSALGIVIFVCMLEFTALVGLAYELRTEDRKLREIEAAMEPFSEDRKLNIFKIEED